MPSAVLFHHALGFTDGLASLADRVTRETGVVVARPDLFTGEPSSANPTRYGSIEAGVDAAQQIGFGEIADRGVAAAKQVAGPLIVIGWSLGALPAVQAASADLDVAAVMLIDGAVPFDGGGTVWPEGIELEIHGIEGDAFFEEDRDIADEMIAASNGTLVMHNGAGHLAGDPSAETHDPAVAAALADAIVDFVARHAN